MQGLLRAGKAKNALPIFVAAGLAGATASAALYPLDVVRSRLMCDTVRAWVSGTMEAAGMQAYKPGPVCACTV